MQKAVEECILKTFKAQIIAEKNIILLSGLKNSYFDFNVEKRLQSIIESKKEMINHITMQIVFDILYDKYQEDSPLIQRPQLGQQQHPPECTR